MMKIVLPLLIFSILFSCKAKHNIVDKPIIFKEERKQLTLAYLKNRYGLVQEYPHITPKMIVLHWTAIPTLEKSFAAFNSTTLPNWRPDIKQVSSLNVSTHFIVDRDGTTYRLLPETTMARHVIGLNHCAIGIENVGGGEEGVPLTQKQLEANIRLVKYLKKKYKSIQYLIGHYEYTLFKETPLWLESDNNYRTIKTDPGKDFMQNVRTTVKDLNFKPLPIQPKS